jgi:hypothetical protein
MKEKIHLLLGGTRSPVTQREYLQTHQPETELQAAD